MVIQYIGIPDNDKLPFFAYGFFKPGQLAYHRIEKYVKNEPSAEIITHEMHYRDGIASIDSEENDTYKTSGYLIEFATPQKAYEEIGNSINKELYKWKQINVNGTDANALVGVKDNPGCFNNRDYITSTYDYRQDPFFNEALELIEDAINEYENIFNMKDFFKIQMHYMLLWSIIERFCTLSYGHFNIGKNKDTFAQEKSFLNELENITRKDEIYPSDGLIPKHINPNHWKSIFYYYTIRCNVVHKGKSVGNEDLNKLKYSLEELYNLFIAVYKNKLIQNDIILKKYPEKRL